MPTADEKKEIAKIAQQYHVSLARAETIYWGHRQNLKKKRRLNALERRTLTPRKKRS